jgi:hypothetical protein
MTQSFGNGSNGILAFGEMIGLGGTHEVIYLLQYYDIGQSKCKSV